MSDDTSTCWRIVLSYDEAPEFLGLVEHPTQEAAEASAEIYRSRDLPKLVVTVRECTRGSIYTPQA